MTSALPYLWLIDTCVASELPKPDPNPQVTAWMQKHVAECAMSAVSVGEIEDGLLRLSPGARRVRLLNWFSDMCEQFGGGILASDLAVWREYARLKRELEQLGRPQADMDILIAATALTHRLTLVTRNIKHFKDTGCQLLDPWTATT
jgi:toxin FitB